MSLSLRPLARTLRNRWRRVDGVYRQLTSSRRRLPDFLIIGASKSGTTSLYDQLVEHPQIEPAAVKEVHFFDDRFDRGIEWYRSQFPLANSRSHSRTGEASPYYLFHPHAPRRIRRALPDVKLIALLRNPIERAYSHYQHEVRVKRESLSFEEALAREPERLNGELERMLEDEGYNSFNYRRYSYLARGRYADQIAVWRQLFPEAQLMVIKSEDFFADPGPTYQQVLQFLQLPSWRPRYFSKRNANSYSPISDDIRRTLARHFAPHNERLYSLIGKGFGWD